MQQRYNFGACTYALIIVFAFALKMPTFNCDNLTLKKNTQALLTANLCAAVRTNWNRIISPALIQDSLLVAALGTRRRSKTRTELLKAAQFTGSNCVVARRLLLLKKHIDIQNYLYVNDRFELSESFDDLITYAATATNVNFTQSDGVAKEINAFVANNTGHLLRKDENIVNPRDLSNDLAMISLNFITFSAEWETPFEDSDKKHYMHRLGNYLYGQVEELNATAVKLPLKGTKSYVLFVFTPTSLMGLEKRLQSVDVTKIHEVLNYTETDLVLPTFKFQTVYSLDTKTISKLNVKAALSKNAGFGNFHKDEENLYLKHLNQFSTIIVDKDGFKFSSATNVRYELSSSNIPRNPEPFMFFQIGQKPYFYYIINDNDVLAAGSSYNDF